MLRPNEIRRYIGESRALRRPVSVSRQATVQELHHQVLARLGFGNGDAYSNGELAAARRILDAVARRPAVVFDVGADRGDYPAMLLEELERDLEVVCFEPSATAFAELERRFGADSRVRAQNVGLSDADGTGTLHLDQGRSGCASLYERAGLPLVSVEEVRLRRLDGLWDELGVAAVDLLKVDAEGHDLAVLRGAGDLLDGTRIRAIQFEHGGTAPDARIFVRDFFELLEPVYRIHRILPDGLWPLERYAEDVEITVYANYLALPR